MDEPVFHNLLQTVQADRSQGASQLARRSLQLMAQSAQRAPADTTGELLKLLVSRCDRLIAARPSMAPIANLLGEWKAGLTRLDMSSLPEIRTSATDNALMLIRQSEQALQETVENAVAYIGSDKTLITHSLSSTVLQVLLSVAKRNIRVIVSESRPLNEGHQLARRLAEAGIPTQLITDAQLGLFVPKAGLALLGADSLLSDGSLVNKAGSYLLALAAHDNGVPVCVCCESFKRRKQTEEPAALEEMDAAELHAPSLSGVRVRNIYFDITPARLIDCWIDERGVHAACT